MEVLEEITIKIADLKGVLAMRDLNSLVADIEKDIEPLLEKLKTQLN